MTQEQLALMLGVSRQSVTKWEAEKSYPEMDKLLKLCQIFDVTLDDLVQGDLTTSTPTAAVQARAAVLREAAGGPPQDVCGYDEHMRTFAWKIAWGVFAILGIALIFTGIVLTALTDSLSEFVQTEAAALMMGLIAVGVWCIVYGSMMLGRLNIANYNDAREQAIAESDEGKVIANSDAAALRAMYTDEQICALLGVPEASDEEIERARARIERKRRKDQLTSGLCACIMIVATIAGLVMLFVPEYETPYFWLAWAIGGLLCAVAAIAVGSFVKDQPSR